MNVRGKMSFLSITRKRFEERKYQSILPIFFMDPPLEKNPKKQNKKTKKTIINKVE